MRYNLKMHMREVPDTKKASARKPFLCLFYRNFYFAALTAAARTRERYFSLAEEPLEQNTTGT